MLDLGFFLQILLTLLVGYLIGRREQRRRKKNKNKNSPLFSQYCVGLNYLLNDQTDAAIDSFVLALENDTFECQLLFGRLFRQRGALEKAIRIHQDILARPCLTHAQMLNIQFELVLDYLKAGLLDRAENLLVHLLDERWSGWKDCVATLLSVYETEKEWLQAIELVQRLEEPMRRQYAHRLSHYHCQIAEQALIQGNAPKARQYLNKACTADPHNVRTSLLIGRMEMMSGRYAEAIESLKRIIYQDQQYISEGLDMLRECHEQTDSLHGFTSFLNRCVRLAPTLPVILALASLKVRTKGIQEGVTLVGQHVTDKPSLEGICALAEFHAKAADGQAIGQFEKIHTLACDLMRHRPLYRCKQCGFAGRELHWHCPQCHMWGSTVPMRGVCRQHSDHLDFPHRNNG